MCVSVGKEEAQFHIDDIITLLTSKEKWLSCLPVDMTDSRRKVQEIVEAEKVT